MFKKFLMVTFMFLLFFTARNVFADSVIDNGLNYLKTKQDETGRINTGFSAPSQWSAIAFAGSGIDISTIKNPSVSLQDFLVTNIPSEPSAATDWETRILAIVATGNDPTNFGGTNYVSHLESFYKNNQIGDECSLNDDIFGLLAEISAETSSSAEIKQNDLDYLISKQDATDGGFGYSAPGCSYYSTSADMTGAAIQALVAAKQNGLTNSGLDNSISNAKNYLSVNQNSDGGYGYYGSSDTDTTGWVLMAFNVLDTKDSTVSAKTKDWLISQQSPTDGGFLAFDYGLNKFISNSTTTAQTIIALSGKSWILKIFDPTTSPTPTPTGSENPTPTNTTTPLASPEPTAKVSANTPTPTPTNVQTPNLVVSITPTITPTPTIIVRNGFKPFPTDFVQTGHAPSPTNSKNDGQILGVKTVSQPPNNNLAISSMIFFGLGLIFTVIHLLKMGF